MRQEHSAEFKNFSPDGDVRLNTFLSQHMKDTQYTKLWRVFKMLLTMFHGQAAVERGYSVNNDLLVENMKERTVIALRTVYDGVRGTGQHFSEVPFTPRLKRRVKAARMWYQQYLEEQKKATLDDQKTRKRKAIQDDMQAVERKKKLVKESMEAMTKEADELAKKAEKKQDFTLLSKSNTFRQKVTEKATEDKKLDVKLKDLKEKLKSLE